MSKRAAFTLIELLVVIAILSLLVSILLPSLKRAKEQAQAIMCMSNESGIFKALALYAEDNADTGGTIPRSGVKRDAHHNALVDMTYEEEEEQRAYTTTWNQFLAEYPRSMLEGAPDAEPSGATDGTYWRSPIPYVDDVKIFDCPAKGENEFLGTNRHQPYGGISPWASRLYGCYGLNMRECGWSFLRMHKIARPDMLYGFADSSYSHFVLWGPQSDPNNVQTYEPRHGKYDTINLAHMDGHVAPTYEGDIIDAEACEYYLGVYGAALPWRNADNIYIPPLPPEP